MAWGWITQPTGDFKFEETQSPTGKALTLKGVRAMPHPVEGVNDAQEFNGGLQKFFEVFGMTMPSLVNNQRGMRTEKSALTGNL